MSEISQKGFDDSQDCGAVGNPRGARQRWKDFRKVENCRGTTFKVPKNRVVDGEAGWSTEHSLCCATSVL